MAVQKITIAQFIELAQQYPVLDVRSPGEYAHAHIPGAYSLPLFTDAERKVVGTAYKQESRKKAIRIGLDYFGVKMRVMVEETETLINHPGTEKKQNEQVNQNCVLVHCWRGGMRSEGVAWLLDLYGFKVYTLTGGYKSYRKWTRMQFEKKYNFTALSGYTGSGKTLVLHELKRIGVPVIDLEGLANHKGSAFGAFGQPPQPSQEMFENLLADELFMVSRKISFVKDPALKSNSPAIFIEDESRRIGLLHIPNNLWDTLQNNQRIFIDIPFEERLGHLSQEYGTYEKDDIINAITRIQKRLGGQEAKMAINHILENDHKECFRILLKYYDKCYGKTMQNRENIPSLLNKITCEHVDVKNITNTLINERATV